MQHPPHHFFLPPPLTMDHGYVALCKVLATNLHSIRISFIPFTSDPWTTQELGAQDPQTVQNLSINFWLQRT